MIQVLPNAPLLAMPLVESLSWPLLLIMTMTVMSVPTPVALE
jgi:hypothetical protein